MASEQTLSTGDLRAHSIDYNRDNEHKHKWAHGQEFGPGRRAEDERPRPLKLKYVARSFNQTKILTSPAGRNA